MVESDFEVLRKVILNKTEPTVKDLQILLEGAASLVSENREEVKEDLLKIAQRPSVLMNDPSPEGDTLTRFFRLAENEESTMDPTLRSVLLYLKDHIQLLFFAEDSTDVVANFLERHTEGSFEDLQTESLYLGAQPWNKEDPFSMPVGYGRKRTPTGRLMPVSTVWKQDEEKPPEEKPPAAEAANDESSQLESLDESADMADFERSVDELGILSSGGKSSDSVGHSGDELGILSSQDEAFDSNDATAIVEVPVLNPPEAEKPAEDQLQLIASRPLESEECLTPPQAEAPTILQPPQSLQDSTKAAEDAATISEILQGTSRSAAPEPAAVAPEATPAAPAPAPTTASDAPAEASLSDSQKKISSIRKRKSQRLQQSQASVATPLSPPPRKGSALKICLALILGFGLGLIPYLVVLKQKMDKEKLASAQNGDDHEAAVLALIQDWDKQVQSWNEETSESDRGAAIESFEKKHKDLSAQLKAHESDVTKSFYKLADKALLSMSKQLKSSKILWEMQQALKNVPAEDKSPLKVEEIAQGFALDTTSPCHSLLAQAKETLTGHSNAPTHKQLLLAQTKVRSFEYKRVKSYITGRKRINNREGIVSLLRQATREIDPEAIVFKEDLLQTIHELTAK